MTSDLTDVDAGLALQELCRGEGFLANLPRLSDLQREALGGGDDADVTARIRRAISFLPNSKEKLTLVVSLNLPSLSLKTLQQRRRYSEELTNSSNNTVIRNEMRASMQVGHLIVNYRGHEPVLWVDLRGQGSIGLRPSWADAALFSQSPMVKLADLPGGSWELSKLDDQAALRKSALLDAVRRGEPDPVSTQGDSSHQGVPEDRRLP